MTIAQNIKALREQHRLSQSELAKILGVTPTAVSSWETGDRTPRMGPMQKMADYFSISVGNLIAEDGLRKAAEEKSKQEIMKGYEQLSPAGKLKIQDYLNDLLQNPNNLK